MLRQKQRPVAFYEFNREGLGCGKTVSYAGGKPVLDWMIAVFRSMHYRSADGLAHGSLQTLKEG
ncbi:hypothetical protein K239x_42840 [Planctomycetes bacterium K23_9]|uniref:Uncharacterized protein n=1 Tax=Stieleria marina TaxID=1930275 RepID=A0A517NYT6_9BACT|nr:hypothetical protein K239x_42840 [Planctomycetes bacterium K23_9]